MEAPYECPDCTILKEENAALRVEVEMLKKLNDELKRQVDDLCRYGLR